MTCITEKLSDAFNRRDAAILEAMRARDEKWKAADELNEQADREYMEAIDRIEREWREARDALRTSASQ